jgi:hypothetical protein
MASGTQVDLDWAGMDSAPGGAGVSPVTAASDATGPAYLTDEEILGIGPPNPGSDGLGPENAGAPAGTRPAADPENRGIEGTDALKSNAGRAEADPAVEMPAWMAVAAGDPRHSAEAQALWREHQEFRAAFASPEEARAVKELLPGGVRDVLSLREATQSVQRIDAALFSGDARAQAEVVAEIARANPAAFRSLFAEAAKVVAGLGTGSREAGGKETGSFDGSDSSGLSGGPTLQPASGQALRTNREGWGNRNSEAGAPRLEADATQITDRNSSVAHHQSVPSDVQPSAANLRDSSSHQSPALRASQSPVTSHSFDPAAYAAFERATNDTVARDVRGSISDTLARVLPDGVAEGAARRIGEDIFHEVHRALAADRSLSEQVAGVLHDRRFGGAEQQRVASLLAGRAKQLVPSVARRVIGEWTGTVLNTARGKAARQAAAASRVDIAASGGSRDSMPLRQMSPREVSYASMSDEEILGM